MAPIASGVFASVIFMLIKTTVHSRKDPLKWAVFTSPFFFLIAGTICTLSVVYKGSPNLGLDKKPAWYIASVTLGVGFGLFILAGLFFVPYVHCKVIKKDYTLKITDIWQGPALFHRVPPADATQARVPNYAVIQHDDDEQDAGDLKVPGQEPTKDLDVIETTPAGSERDVSNEKNAPVPKTLAELEDETAGLNAQAHYRLLLARAEAKHHAFLRTKRGPIGWAMRTLHNNPMGSGEIYERHNLWAFVVRLPAHLVCALLYGVYYDIHGSQIGILGTPEGRRMAVVYEHATKYQNEVEYLYSFVQIITACTASFAHGANDVGNAVGVWAGMYGAWQSGQTVKSKEDVPSWQIAVMAITICIGFITYGYNIMKVMGNKLTYHSPSRGSSMEMGAAITTLIFSQYKLPVSTSMCITGATVGVGLCNGTYKAVNWQRVGLLFFSWIVTIPIAGLIGGGLMALALNAPSY
jgi:sodium-dependent phosphate transporter